MRKTFIADAHLKEPTDGNYRRLLQFFDRCEGTVDTLVILGDLFDLWIGSPPLLLPSHRPVIHRLAALARSGVRIIWLEGNHDFNLGPVVTEEIGAEVFPGPVEMTFDGVRCHLCHGDQINPHDRGYRLLRALLRSTPARILPRLLPRAATLRIARLLDRHCSAEKRNARRFDPIPLIERYAAERFREGADVVVTGHFHCPFMRTWGEKRIVSVGDWVTQFSHASLEEGVWSLETFSPGR